jgi:hypothetical protein
VKFFVNLALAHMRSLIDALQSFDEITERSLPYAKGGSKCEDFVHLTQLWLGRMQVAFWCFYLLHVIQNFYLHFCA